MAQLFANGARAALSAGIAAGDTTLTIASGGALFPIANTDTGAVGGSLDWFKAVLDDGTNFEIVYIRTHTSASTNFTNVLRGQEGTTARAFSAGKVLGVRVTAEDMRLSVGREMLTAARTYYVRTAPAAVTFTNASANVTWAAHGLSVNAAVVLSILPNTGTFTVTLASPGVFTKVGHGYAAGRPVKFSTTGALPTDLTAGTTYYVIAAGLTADAFQVSATVGGAAVNTSGSQSGTHYAEATGAMPTFSTAGLLVAGTVYYVNTVVDANNVTLSTTAGGAALGACTVATGSPIYSASTGSDSNAGLVNTAAGAFLTIQKAIDTAAMLDSSIYNVTIQVADGVCAGNFVAKSMVGAGAITLQGNTATPANCTLTVASGVLFASVDNRTAYALTGVKFVGSGTASRAIQAVNSIVRYGLVEFVSGFTAMHVQVTSMGRLETMGNYTISGGAPVHVLAQNNGFANTPNFTCTLTGTPAFSSSFASAGMGGIIYAEAVTYSGAATGARYFVDTTALIKTLGGANHFPGSVAGTATSPGLYI